jgi:hypothetical protein
MIELIDAAGNRTRRTIRPNEYTGIPLDVWTYEDEDCGKVEVKLYRARSSYVKLKGIVSVHQSDDLYMLPWKNFRNQAQGMGWTITTPVFAELASGYFEGVISVKGIELDPQRTKFVRNDALVSLYAVLDHWWNEVGSGIMNDEREKVQAARFQNMGIKILEYWSDMLASVEYASLRAALLNTFVMGRLGTGHVDPASGGPVDGVQEETSVRTGQGGAGKPRNPRERPSGGSDRDDRDPDRPGDLPLGVIGPRGRQRTLVQSDSIGLQLAYEPLDSARLWELDATLGILYFNTAHRLWDRCEKKDAHLLHLQDWIVMSVLHLLMQSIDQFEVYREFVDAEAKTYVEKFILSSPPKKL